MRKIEAKSTGIIAFFVLSFISIIVGVGYKAINTNFDPSGFYYLAGGLFLVGIMILVFGKGSIGSFHLKI